MTAVMAATAAVEILPEHVPCIKSAKKDNNSNIIKFPFLKKIDNVESFYMNPGSLY